MLCIKVTNFVNNYKVSLKLENFFCLLGNNFYLFAGEIKTWHVWESLLHRDPLVQYDAVIILKLIGMPIFSNCFVMVNWVPLPGLLGLAPNYFINVICASLSAILLVHSCLRNGYPLGLCSLEWNGTRENGMTFVLFSWKDRMNCL